MKAEVKIHIFPASARTTVGEEPTSGFSRSYPVDMRRLRRSCRDELLLFPLLIVRSTFNHEDKVRGA
jgi:hypothetical protein